MTEVQLMLPPETIFYDISDVKATNSRERIVEFVACSESPIERYNWFNGEKYLLILSHDNDAIGLDRVKNGVCSFLEGHTGIFSNPSRIGKIIDAKVLNKQLITTHKISTTSAGNEYWKEIESATQPGISIEAKLNRVDVVKKAKYEAEENDDGYTRKKLIEPAILKATSWELLCIASVNIPAFSTATKTKKQKLAEQQCLSLVQFNSSTGYEWIQDLEEDDMDTPPQQRKAPLYFDLNSKEKNLNSKEKNMSVDKETNQLNDQLVSENRDLKVKLADSDKELKAVREESRKQELAASYWKLRNKAIELYAVDNKLTEDDFRIDFSEDPNVDLEKFYGLSPDSAKLELMGIERDLNRASRKSPLERVPIKDQEKLESRELESTKDQEVERKHQEESKEDLSDVDEFLRTTKPRTIGKISY